MITNILDDIIEQCPKSFPIKERVILMSRHDYKNLCKHLNRKVKTYKKHKVKSL